MTPKEKAEELVTKYKGLVTRDYKYDDEPIFDCQKECALILVEDIISENKLFPYNTIFYERINFWEKVKVELNKM